MASDPRNLPPARAAGGAHGGSAPADPEGIGPATGLLAEFPALERIERWVSLAPAVVLFAMMVLTFANVFLRYLFRAPLSGALEILSYLMGVLVFLALPLVTLRGEHVRISLLDGWLPAVVRRVRGVAFNLVMAAIAGMLGWRLWLFGERLMSWGDRTQQYGLSLGGLALMFAVSCGIMAVIFALTALRAALNRGFVNRMDL